MDIELIVSASLLLLIAPFDNSHPLGYILKRDDFISLKILSCGTIISEYYIVTTKHTIQLFALSDMCALGMTPQRSFVGNITVQLKELCMPVEAVFEETNDLRVVKTERPIQFSYGVNVAMIPQVNSYLSPFNLSSPCAIYYHKRDDTQKRIQSLVLVPISLKIEEGSAPFVLGNFAYDAIVMTKGGYEYCLQDTGVAVVCRAAVIGMLVMNYTSDQIGSTCCVTSCMLLVDMVMLNFASPTFQEVLMKYIKSEKSDAVMFDNLTSI